jgi:hypothetical protein
VGAFDLALTMLAYQAISLPTHSLARSLLEAQRFDGSRVPSAWLRLVDRTISEPCNALDAGPIYLDEQSVFTTAAAVGALANYVGEGYSVQPFIAERL